MAIREPLMLYLPAAGTKPAWNDRVANASKLTRSQRFALENLRDQKGADLMPTRRAGGAFHRMMRSLAFAGLIEQWDDPQWPASRCVRLTAAGLAALEPKYRAKQPEPGTCRECGCTEFAACPSGCAWADGTMTICTQCAGVEP